MMDYRKAGVDIDKAATAKRIIAAHARTTFPPCVLQEIGHFGGFFPLPSEGPAKPVLVASTDGVGTKLLLANRLGRLEGVGADLVHHCINDILACGAAPLFFLDYMAFGRLEIEKVTVIAQSLAGACRAHGVALIGGETAEMPDMYRESDFDLAGTIVGWVDEGNILDRRRVVEGDVLLGLSSNGLHTNGYSLVRRIFATEIERGELLRADPKLGESLADALLRPHRCYLPSVKSLLGSDSLHAMAHITGGGLADNIRRVLPERLRAEIDWLAWPRLPIFQRIAAKGNIGEEEMRRVFNLSIGLVLVVSKRSAKEVSSRLRDASEEVYPIGQVVA
ncbi:MAG: phosphoribosylformylglycinamidine cyclo-ligase [bacterium]